MCWRCKNDEVYNTLDNNGMCFNCYAACKEAMEQENTGEWQDGEPH